MYLAVLCRYTYKRENAFLKLIDNKRYGSTIIHEYNTQTRVRNVILTWPRTRGYVFNNNKIIMRRG